MKSLRQAYLEAIPGIDACDQNLILQEINYLLFLISLGMPEEQTAVDRLLASCEKIQKKLLEEE